MSPDSNTIESTFENTETFFAAVHSELERKDQLSIITLTEAIIKHAAAVRASDIHIDPTKNNVCVRFRIDGILETAHVLPLRVHTELIARLKILSGLRTDEHHAAQDGRFHVPLDSGNVMDVRIAIAPTYYGENVVLRLLVPLQSSYSLEALGFSPEHRTTILKTLSHKSGMILVTGPTGSGKTTTLYALMQLLTKESISLITIEDPIEYSIEGTTQIQATRRTGLSFAQGLRSILRQDPDIIMVGEIRDEETAGLSINAALTGHLVLSTLHTSDAATTLPRLLDLHIEPYLVSSTIRLIIAQRLVRRICNGCKTKSKKGKETEPYHASGCSVCNETGYHGRIGIYELLEINERVEGAIHARTSARELKRVAQECGMITMLEDAHQKISLGLTTKEEVLRLEYA